MTKVIFPVVVGLFAAFLCLALNTAGFQSESVVTWGAGGAVIGLVLSFFAG